MTETERIHGVKPGDLLRQDREEAERERQADLSYDVRALYCNSCRKWRIKDDLGGCPECDTWGARLRALRKSKGLSLRRLAAAALVSVSYLSRVERGQFPPPSADTIAKLAVVLGVDSSALCRTAGKTGPAEVEQLRERVAELEREGERLYRVVMAVWESETCEDPDCRHGHTTDVLGAVVDAAEAYQAAHPGAPTGDPEASVDDNVRRLLELVR